MHFAVEACTSRLFVQRALAGCGAVAHLAEPVETSALRGRKRRARLTHTGARWLRELVVSRRLPEAWIPHEHACKWRSRATPQLAGRRAHQLGAAHPRHLPSITTMSSARLMICAPSKAAGSSPA